MAGGYRPAIESIVLTSVPMDDQNQIPNPFSRLSEAADAAEDVVHACERMHLDRLAIYYTPKEYENVLLDLHRLRDAVEKLSSIIQWKWESLKTIAEESEQSFEAYTDDVDRRL